MKILLILFFSLFQIILNSQADSIEWQKCLGGTKFDQSQTLIQTNDNGYIFVGRSESKDGNLSGNKGQSDLWVVKLNSDGLILWQKNVGGTSFDFASSISQTTDGGYILAGVTSSNNLDVTFNNGLSDAWVLKLNTFGDIEWQNTYGGSNHDSAHSIVQTNEGEYTFIGVTLSNDQDVDGNHGGYDVWVVKLNHAGQILSQKCYGGSQVDSADKILKTDDGGYIFTGFSFSNDGDLLENNGNSDVWTVKLDINGNIEWQSILGGTSFDVGNDIIQTNEGSYVICGGFRSNSGEILGNQGDWDSFVIKLAKNGNVEWQKSFGGSLRDVANTIIQTINGGYIFGGVSKSSDGNLNENKGLDDAWIVKLSEIGNVDWQENYGGTLNDEIFSIIQNTNGTYVFCGVTESNDFDVYGNNGNMDAWIVKLGSSNNADCLHPDFATLISLFQATNGLGWTNNSGWKQGSEGTNCDPCNGWYGVNCINNRVQSIILNNNQLEGIIPSVITNLTELNFLSLQDNRLYGCIDPALKAFCNKIYVDFDNNNKLPWKGDFILFCQTNGSIQSQLSASCNDSIDITLNDKINEDCICYGVIIDTCFTTIYDTITIYNNVTIYDTLFTIIRDTIFTNITNYISVSDTLIINLNLINSSNELLTNKIKIYPNPSSSHIYIDITERNLLSNFEIQILNALGQPLFYSPIEQSQYYINLNDWGGKGIYFIKIINSMGITIETKKIILK